MQIICTINSKPCSLKCEPDQRALDILRAMGMLSVKEGCGEGACGACSIFFNGKLINRNNNTGRVTKRDRNDT